MPTKDGFDPPHLLPQFLAVRAEQDVGNAPDRVVVASSRVFKTGILIAAALATGIAALAMGNPVALLAEMSASLVGGSPPQSTPSIQSVADAPIPIPSVVDAKALPPQSLPPAAKDTPAREEIAASEPAGKDQTDKTGQPSETLFSQFQAWAAEQDARGAAVQPAQDEPPQLVQTQAAQNARAPAAENVRVPYRLVQKRRQIRAVQNARAEVRTQNRRQVRRAQSASAERPPAQDPRAQDPRAQDPAAQNAQTPSFLQPIFGPRN